jgi:hypothetical protein
MNTDSKGNYVANETLTKFLSVVLLFLFFSSTLGLFGLLIILELLNSLNTVNNLSNDLYSSELAIIFGIFSILLLMVIYLILIPIIRKKKTSQEIFGFYIVTYILGVQSIALFGFFIGLIELLINGRIINWNIIGLFFVIAIINGIWLYKKEIKSSLKT